MQSSATVRIRRHCPLAAGVKKVAAAHLQKTGLVVCGDGMGGVVLKSKSDKGFAEPISLDDAWRGGLLQVQPDGSLDVCGTRFEVVWDTAKIRRRLEDKVRKTTTPGDLIKVATCLGVDIL